MAWQSQARPGGCSDQQRKGVTVNRKVLFCLGKEERLLVSVLLAFQSPTQAHTLPTHYHGALEGQVSVSDQEWAQPPGSLGALLSWRCPRHLFIVQGPFGRHCPLSRPPGAVLLQILPGCVRGGLAWGARGLAGVRRPPWKEAALEGGPGCGFHFSA